MAIRILTDSAADYTKEEIEKRQIQRVSMAITFGEETYLDGVDLTKEEFYEKLINGKDFPKTSQPAPGDFLDCFEAAKESGDSVIVILISGAISGTIQSAHLAKEMAGYDDIYIVDSQNVTMGIRLLVDQAVLMREKGFSAQEIVGELEKLKGRIRLFAGLETLEYLSKGGRISKTAASIGNLANLKPVVQIDEEGKVDIIGKQIGTRRAYKSVLKCMEEHQPDCDYPVYYIYCYDK
ncbi:MAG: DegV family protein, partial [Blautia sp.]|nr:DegV family protein [Blautia sp.]